MPNPVTHWQILTKQPQELEKFYSTLFGWKISGDNPMGYKTVDTDSGEGVGGGLWPIGPNEGHSMVQLFVSVDDVPAYLKQAEELGASVVSRLERWVVVQAPTGHRFCVVRVQRPGFPKNASAWI